MHKTLLALAIVAGVCFSAHLPAGPDPIEWAEREEAKMQQNQVSKRQIPWYLPVITVPQIVEVHHVVVLQSPDTRCYPAGRPFPPRPPTPSPTPGPMPMPGGGDDDDLGGRMGGGTTNGTATQPSRCVWAIVACCAPGSSNIRYTCFELLGCQGAFWDVNPCDTRVTMAAANTALKFYMSNPPPTNNNVDDVTSNLTQ